MRKIVASVLFGATATAAMVPVGPASAEAGCDDGENTGATKVIASSSSWRNDSDAWRYYVRLSPAGTSAYVSTFNARRDDGNVIWYRQFEEFTGKWDTGHFDEMAEHTLTNNQTGATRTYYYKRSCMKS